MYDFALRINHWNSDTSSNARAIISFSHTAQHNRVHRQTCTLSARLSDIIKWAILISAHSIDSSKTSANYVRCLHFHRTSEEKLLNKIEYLLNMHISANFSRLQKIHFCIFPFKSTISISFLNYTFPTFDD